MYINHISVSHILTARGGVSYLDTFLCMCTCKLRLFFFFFFSHNGPRVFSLGLGFPISLLFKVAQDRCVSSCVWKFFLS